MTERPIIHRRNLNAITEVPVPQGYRVCPHCKGAGAMSKYDEGWRSFFYDADLAAMRVCFRCNGLGYVSEIRDD